jgi:hypothetical protein
MNTERKHTKFQTCERHEWLNKEGRRRRAEFFVEGGPAGQKGCSKGECRLWPGLDIFEPSVCHEEMALDWTQRD